MASATLKGPVQEMLLPVFKHENENDGRSKNNAELQSQYLATSQDYPEGMVMADDEARTPEPDENSQSYGHFQRQGMTLDDIKRHVPEMLMFKHDADMDDRAKAASEQYLVASKAFDEGAVDRMDDATTPEPDENSPLYRHYESQGGESESFFATDADFEFGKSKKRRKQSNPVRITATKHPNGLFIKCEGQNEQAKTAVSFSPESSTSSPDLPLNLSNWSGARYEPDSGERINIANIPPELLAANNEWLARLQENLPFATTPGLQGKSENSKDGGTAQFKQELQFLPQNFPPGSQEAANAAASVAGSVDFTKAKQDKVQSSLLASLVPFGPTPFLPFFLPTAATGGSRTAAGSPRMPGSSANPMPRMPTSQSMPGTPGGIRIFNPEAYCHICNKEFCNKYFLKTHKANKHGIYQGESNSPQSGSIPTSPLVIRTPFAPGGFMQANMGNIPIRPILPSAPAPFKPVPAPPKKEPAPKVPGKINPEAFCVLCQKEFCNKYFLKRHKQKIHGIAPPDPPPEGQKSQNGVVKPKSEGKEGGKSKSSSKSHHAQRSPIALTVAGKAGAVEFPHVFPCTLCKFTSKTKFELENHLKTIHEIGLQNAPMDMRKPLESGKIPQFPEDEEGQVMMIPAQIFQLFPEDKLLDKLQELGVNNPELLCHLCGKEFSDSRYLAQHRIACHSQPAEHAKDSDQLMANRQPEEVDDNPVQWKIEYHDKNWINAPVSTTQHMATISNGASNQVRDMGNQVTAASMQNIPDRSPQHNQEAKDEIAAEVTQQESSEMTDVSCSDCGRPFMSAYWLQLHQRYFHSQKDTSGDDTNLVQQMHESMQSDGDPQGMPQNLEKTASFQGKISADSERIEAANRENTSEDLQKLQSMIMELNNADAAQSCEGCSICFKRFGSPQALKLHIMKDHSSLQGATKDDGTMTIPTDTVVIPGQTDAAISPLSVDRTSMKSPGELEPQTEESCICPLCKKDFFVKEILTQHLQAAHGIPPRPLQHQATATSTPSPKPPKLGNEKSDASKTEKKSSWAASRSYCQICNKELCNKYFMKTHMLKMHGINIDNGSMLGGVTCEICNKELCSKYFLKVHKQNTHGILDLSCGPWNGNLGPEGLFGRACEDPEGRLFAQMSEEWRLAVGQQAAPDAPSHPPPKKKKSSSKTPKQEPPVTTTAECPHCPATFMDKVALHVHMIKNHPSSDKETGAPEISAKEEQQGATFRCSMCPFSTSMLPAFMAHERSHMVQPQQQTQQQQLPTSSLGGKMQCPVCFHWLPSVEVFHQHFLSHQLNPFLTPFFNQFGSSVAYDVNSCSNALTSLAQRQMQEDVDDPESRPEEMESAMDLLGQPEHGSMTQMLAEAVLQQGNLGKRKRPRFKFKCSMCKRGFRKRSICLSHIQSFHNPRNKSVNYVWPKSVWKRRIYRCSKCAFSSPHLFKVRAHVRDWHRPKRKMLIMDSDEQSPRMLPESCAKPAHPNLQDYDMQPFMVVQHPDDSQEQSSAGSPVETKFVPSLVYLPVTKKASQPFFARFALTPA